MAEWECDHSGTSYSDQDPFYNSDDQDTCMICHKPKGKTRPNGGGKKPSIKSPLPLIVGAAALLILGGGGYLLLNQKKTAEKPTENTTSTSSIPVTPTPVTPPNTPPVTTNSSTLSSGETRLMIGQSNPDTDNGIQAFQSVDFTGAIQAFGKAVQGDRRNPEPQIYLNNAKARQAGTPFLLAVVVPIDNAPSSAEEMLRGVADAQTNVILIGGDIINIEFAEGRKSVNEQGVVTNQVSGPDQVAEETLKPKFQNTTLEFRPDGRALMNLIDTNGPNVDPNTYPWSGTWSSVDGYIDFSVGWSGTNDSGAEVSHLVQGRIVEVSNGSYVIKMNYQRSHVFAVSRPLPYSHSYYTNATFTQIWNRSQ